MTTETSAISGTAGRGNREDSGSQTLSRGIRILELLAEHGRPMSIPEIVVGVGLHRSIVYRLLRTLEQHRLLSRDDRGLVSPGARLAMLAASVERDIQSAARPALRGAAEDLGATCFLVTLDGEDVVTLVSVEPSRTRVTVAEHPGTRHPLGIGAPGRAILMQLPDPQWPAALADEHRQQTREVRVRGYATSYNEVIPGLHSVAVPLPLHGRTAMAVACVYVHASTDDAEMGARLTAAAAEIRAAVAA